MIAGIGTDIIEINRIKKVIISKPEFIIKSFTIKEQEYFQNRNNAIQTIAGNYAAKESISKALGTGFRGFGLIDIEVLRDKKGMPIVFLYGKAKQIQKQKSIKNIWVSISHCEIYATAYAIAEKSFIY